ncbi:hypothetical protein ONE63_000984 [Megalurothrips usitatus]|uniref:Alkyl transferase n=1 Tax=Megalurothrips usitatus TaxID=439358 RepID=A0AAV7Y2R6_9NEOP|nr:hypothetical protein ONE63_000984 [Megalurothrips usitatus]
MSWVRDNQMTWLQKLGVRIIASGRVPKHVAFIMDGNRRYAKKHNVQTYEGHSKGFDRLAETLPWCSELGIKEVTVYAFSIENFKRPQEEVDALMDLARQKFQRLLDERDKLKEHGVHIRIIGNLELLPEDLRKLMAQAILITKDNNRSILNIAYAYTAREEILQTVKQAVGGVTDGVLSPSNVTKELLSKTLYTNKSPTPDLLIRTSGEVRYSDFLLWQVSCSCVYFTNVLWPDFTLWHLLGAVFYYQRSYQNMQIVRELENQCSENIAPAELSYQVDEFVEKVNEKRLHWLSQHAELEVIT